MNTRTFAAFVIGLTAAGFASAQNVSLHANVPFSFVVGGKTLPAGEYRVSLGPSLATTIIQGDGQAAVGLTIPAVEKNRGNKTARMVFHVYGARCFLTQIWSGGPEGTEFPLTRSMLESTTRKNNVNQSGVAAIREIALHK